MINTNYPELQRKIDYTFTDSNLLILALTHRSHGKANNERLEFLGDALLNSTIAQLLFFQFPEEKEGNLSRLRSELVKGKTLAKIAQDFNLSDYLIMGSGEMKSGGYLRESILADVVEAIIAAIYLDGGLSSAEAFIKNIFKSRLDTISVSKHLKDPKTRLQELLQSRKLTLPVYKMVKVKGQSHDQQFTVACQTVLLKTAPVATASNRRQAEQLAAEQVLAQLEEKLS